MADQDYEHSKLVKTRGGEVSAYKALRRARRDARVGRLDRFEVFYRAYVGFIFLVLGGFIALGRIPRADVPSTEFWTTPQFIGSAFTIITISAIRSGLRGGPLAVDRADLHWILLSPMERRVSLSLASRAFTKTAVLIGAGLGAALGLTAWVSLPGHLLQWIALGSTLGAVSTLGAIGSAMIFSGLRVRKLTGHAVCLLVGMLAGTDLLLHTHLSPTTWLGATALWLLEPSAAGVAGFATFIALGLVGFSLASGISMESAVHRSSLAVRLRFNIASRDVREAVLLRRYLAGEDQRSVPWISTKVGGRIRLPFLRRALRSLNRWPPGRIIRVLLLSLASGWAGSLAWEGSSGWLIVMAAALFLVALDITEPLGQEVDNPELLQMLPIQKGTLILKHLSVSSAIMAVPLALGLGVQIALGRLPVEVGLPTIISGCIGSVTAATLSVILESPPLFRPTDIAFGEAAFFPVVLRQLWRPALVVVSLLPLFTAKTGKLASGNIASAAWTGGVLALGALAAVLMWLRWQQLTQPNQRKPLSIFGKAVPLTLELMSRSLGRRRPK